MSAWSLPIACRLGCSNLTAMALIYSLRLCGKKYPIHVFQFTSKCMERLLAQYCVFKKKFRFFAPSVRHFTFFFVAGTVQGHDVVNHIGTTLPNLCLRRQTERLQRKFPQKRHCIPHVKERFACIKTNFFFGFHRSVLLFFVLLQRLSCV